MCGFSKSVNWSNLAICVLLQTFINCRLKLAINRKCHHNDVYIKTYLPEWPRRNSIGLFKYGLSGKNPATKDFCAQMGALCSLKSRSGWRLPRCRTNWSNIRARKVKEQSKIVKPFSSWLIHPTQKLSRPKATKQSHPDCFNRLLIPVFSLTVAQYRTRPTPWKIPHIPESRLHCCPLYAPQQPLPVAASD